MDYQWIAILDLIDRDPRAQELLSDSASTIETTLESQGVDLRDAK
jgi:hypothetical protein